MKEGYNEESSKGVQCWVTEYVTSFMTLGRKSLEVSESNLGINGKVWLQDWRENLLLLVNMQD